jgi:hypothetical protein
VSIFPALHDSTLNIRILIPVAHPTHRNDCLPLLADIGRSTNSAPQTASSASTRARRTDQHTDDTPDRNERSFAPLLTHRLQDHADVRMRLIRTQHQGIVVLHRKLLLGKCANRLDIAEHKRSRRRPCCRIWKARAASCGSCAPPAYASRWMISAPAILHSGFCPTCRWTYSRSTVPSWPGCRSHTRASRWRAPSSRWLRHSDCLQSQRVSKHPSSSRYSVG